MRKFAFRYLATILAVMAGAWLVLQVLTLTDRSSVSRAEREQLFSLVDSQAAQIEDEQAARSLLAEQVESLGEEPVVPAEPSTAEPLPQQLRYVPIPGPRGLRGLAGDDGGRGATGVQGATGATGEQGPKGDTGDRGPAGADGSAGPPGRGIASGPTCNDDGTWTTTYTDGTSDTQPGPCRVSLIPPA